MKLTQAMVEADLETVMEARRQLVSIEFSFFLFFFFLEKL